MSDEQLNEQPEYGHRNVNLMPTFQYAFDLYCAENELSGVEIEKADLRDFMGWFSDWIKYVNAQELEHETGLHPEDLVILQENSNSPQYLAPLTNYWPLFTLTGRGMPENAVGAVQIVVAIRYRDGRVTPITAYMPEELSDPLNDASVSTFIAQQTSAVVQQVTALGIDKLHKLAVDPSNPNTPPQVIAQLPGEPMFPIEMAEKILETRKLKGIVSKVPPYAEAVANAEAAIAAANTKLNPEPQVARPDPVKISGGFSRGDRS